MFKDSADGLDPKLIFVRVVDVLNGGQAVGAEPATPERFAGIMDADRHVTDLPNDAAAVQDFIRTAASQRASFDARCP